MSSISNQGENEFANDESNIVGKSEEGEEEMAERVLKEVRKRPPKQDLEHMKNT